MKIILNKCFGGFEVSDEGYRLYAKKKGLDLYSYDDGLDSDECGFNYKKTNIKENEWDRFTYFTKDMGDNVEISNEDFSKYCLRLDFDYRKDPVLIEVVEELRDRASGFYGALEIIEIPDNSFYKIDEYDGIEIIYYSDSEINIK